MKNLLVRIKDILYKVIGIDWIVSPVGEDCKPVPVYMVMDVRLRVLQRGMTIVEKPK